MDKPWEAAAQTVLARLADEIVNGELGPGAKISEPEISRRYGVSRAPLREAIRKLEERSLVTREARRSARVVVLSPERVDQIYRVREAIEGMAAREAARNITQAEVAGLKAALRRQREATLAARSKAYPFKRLDTDYHAAIVRASRNEFLIKFLTEDFQALVELCRRRQRAEPQRAAQSLVEHARIVDALAERDEDLAEMLMRRHVAGARAHLVSRLQSPPPKERNR